MMKLYDALLDKISYRALRYICTATLAITAGVMAMGFTNSMFNESTRSFGGQEVTEVHFTPDATVRVVSRISVTKCPANVTYMPIRLSQPGAKLESVTIDKRQISFKPSTKPEEKDTYYAMPSMPENALKACLVEVVWSFPFEEMKAEDGTTRVYLQGTIPIKSYAVNLVIDDGAPYRFGGKFADARNYNTFFTKMRHYTDCNMGYCTVDIRNAEGNK